MAHLHMTVALFCILELPLAPGPQADQDGQALLLKMEEAFTKADTVRLEYSTAMRMGDQKDVLLGQKGTLWLAMGNKVRLDVSGDFRGQPKNALVVSDGTKVKAIRATPSPTKPVKDTHEKLGECVSLTFCRASMYMAQIYLPGAGNRTTEKVEDNVRAVFQVRNVAKIGTETVGGRESTKVTWDLAISGNPGKYKVTMWIDADTYMPLKRVLTGDMRGRTFTVEESYSATELNKELDTKLFTLPD